MVASDIYYVLYNSYTTVPFIIFY